MCADPFGAAMWSWFSRGRLEPSDGDSHAEGIGQTRVTKNLEGVEVDLAYRISDQEALTLVHHLLREEGLCLGLSSGVNLAGAVRFARERGRGQTIVTVLCDSGQKYQSRIYNREWLAARDLDPDRPVESVHWRPTQARNLSKWTDFPKKAATPLRNEFKNLAGFWAI